MAHYQWQIIKYTVKYSYSAKAIKKEKGSTATHNNMDDLQA